MFGDLNFLYQKTLDFFYSRNTNMKLMFLNISNKISKMLPNSKYLHS